jgi:hypothetical protein
VVLRKVKSPAGTEVDARQAGIVIAVESLPGVPAGAGAQDVMTEVVVAEEVVREEVLTPEITSTSLA